MLLLLLLPLPPPPSPGVHSTRSKQSTSAVLGVYILLLQPASSHCLLPAHKQLRCNHLFMQCTV